jgi:hypothetical protein
MAEPQIDKILEQAPQYPPVDRRDEPRVMIKSALRLDRKQEDRLIEWAESRNKTLEGEMGRENIHDVNWYASDPGKAAKSAQTFMGRRIIYEMTFANQVEWRESILRGIFEESNHTVPISRRIVQQQVSRAIKYFVGTEPFMAASPIGESDKEIADKVNRYANFKLRKAKLKKTIERAIYGAFIRGETVVKTTHLDQSVTYETEAVVMIGEDGNPIIAADGDYIYFDDDIIEVEPVVPEGEDPMDFVPQSVLGRDQVTPIPSEANRLYEARTIERTVTHYRGPESKPVYFRDFLCPLNAESIQDADQICHLYDMPVMSLVDMIVQNNSIQGSEDSYIRGLNLIREVASESGQPSTAANKPRPELNESGEDLTSEGEAEATTREPTTEIAETYLRFDVDEDGRYEDVILVYDRKNNIPLFYDHVANVTPDSKRPFRCVRINPVEGRWHGIGSMEIFEPIQKIVDLSFNRWNFSQSSSGRIDLFRPYNTIEGDSNPNLEMNWGGTYTPLPDKTSDDVIETVYLEDIKSDELQNLIEFNLQMAMNMSGVASVNDSEMAGMDSTKLATGIRNIDLSGHELFGVYVSDLEDGIEDLVHQAVLVTMANLDEDEVFEFFEGGAPEMGVMSPAEINHLDLNIRLEMTRYHAEQQLQQNLQASAIVREFYSLPPQIQMQTVQFYVDILKAFQIQNAERYLVPSNVQIGVEPGLPGGPQGAMSAAGGQPKPSTGPLT